MIAAVRQTVRVQAEGRIEIVAPELRVGDVAEVIVLLPAETPTLTPADRIKALEALRKSLGLTVEMADAWVREVRLEREAWRLPGALGNASP